MTLSIAMQIEKIRFLTLMALLPLLGSCGIYGTVPYSRGNTFLQEGQYDAAIGEFNKALEINPKSALTYYHRGLAYSNKGRHDLAVADYTDALALNPGVLEKTSLLHLAYFNRGVSYQATGKLGPAIEDFTRSIELNSTIAEAYAQRGKARLDRRENRQAMVDFNKAVEMKPELANEIKPWLARAKAR
jgi:tetratricopeptide (TPR) repeat protein